MADAGGWLRVDGILGEVPGAISSKPAHGSCQHITHISNQIRLDNIQGLSYVEYVHTPKDQGDSLTKGTINVPRQRVHHAAVKIF